MSELPAAVAAMIPMVGEPEVEHQSQTLAEHVPVDKGNGVPAEELAKHPQPASTPANGASPASIGAHAAAAKGPSKAAKKPVLDPAKYRKAKAPAAEETFSDAAQSTIPVRKPGSRNFFRVHAEEEYRLYDVPVVDDDKHELHLVAADLEIPEDLERFVSRVNLITCLNHKGTLFLWWFKNSTNDWSKSAMRIARRATGEWLRVRADMDANGYRVETAPPELRAVEPKWPKMTFEEILNTAFDGKCIDSIEHPVIRSLRGLGYGAL